MILQKDILYYIHGLLLAILAFFTSYSSIFLGFDTVNWVYIEAIHGDLVMQYELAIRM